MKANKLAAGKYQIGTLVVTRHNPKGAGQTTTWKNDAGEVLGYGLREIVALVNENPKSLVYALARGKTREQWETRHGLTPTRTDGIKDATPLQ